MDSLNLLLDRFGTALSPVNLLWAATGVLLGTAIGVLPGIGPAMAVALLLPVTSGLDPTAAFIMFAGIYYGGMFGGSTTSILLNTPGETAAVVTAIEGHPMARSGRGSQALAAAAIGHFAGGIIGTVLLVVLAPTVASLAVGIGAPDYFAIMVLAFIAVTSVLGRSRVRGFASLLIGLTIGLIGLDSMTGQQRLTFGALHLADGIDVVIVAVGLFALGEALRVAAHLRRTSGKPVDVGRPWLGREELRRSWKPWLRGPVIGFPFGAVPAGGAEIPTFLSYVTTLFRRLERANDTNHSSYSYGPLIMDLSRHEVIVEGKEVTLTAKEFGLLEHLLWNPGRVLTRDVLLNAVWGYDYYGTTRTVDVHIRRLKQKLPLLNEAIVSVKSLGYKLSDLILNK